MTLELKTATLGDTPLLVMPGAFEGSSCASLAEALDAILAARHNVVFLDFAKVTRLDEAGLAVLVRAVQSLGGRGWLGIIAPSAAVQDVLGRGGLLPHPNVLIFETRQAALVATGQRQST